MARKISGTEKPAPSIAPAPTELTIMNSALRMLLAAMTRARWLGWLRSWISAYIGTEYRPTLSASRPRSAITRQWAGAVMNCATVCNATAGRPRDAKYRSIENALMPMAPSGTSPISTWRRDSISQASEPMPMPTENTTSSSEATCSSPCSTSLAKAGKLARKTAPKNHIQLMPSSERNTTMSSRASRRLRQVSDKGFQLMAKSGSVAGDSGTRCAASRPSRAVPTQPTATQVAPTPGSAINSPPATLPSRIATKVPISTMPLPPVISRSDRCCGR